MIGKGKTSKKAKSEPTRGEMHAVVVDILKEVDFNTVSSSYILMLLSFDELQCHESPPSKNF